MSKQDLVKTIVQAQYPDINEDSQFFKFNVEQKMKSSIESIMEQVEYAKKLIQIRRLKQSAQNE